MLTPGYVYTGQHLPSGGREIPSWNKRVKLDTNYQICEKNGRFQFENFLKNEVHISSVSFNIKLLLKIVTFH